jgi:hypothetical protein
MTPNLGGKRSERKRRADIGYGECRSSGPLSWGPPVGERYHDDGVLYEVMTREESPWGVHYVSRCVRAECRRCNGSMSAEEWDWYD